MIGPNAITLFIAAASIFGGRVLLRTLLAMIVITTSFSSLAGTIEPGLWKFTDKSLGSVIREVELLVGAPIPNGQLSMVVSSNSKILNVVGIQFNETGLLTIIVAQSAEHESSGFTRKYFSILKKEEDKISLGSTTFDHKSTKPMILADPSKIEIAVLSKTKN